MSVVYFYLRHGPKAYNNGKAPTGLPQHDPPILDSHIQSIRSVGSELIKNHGQPNMIVMSPYLRVRQTVQELTFSLTENNKEDEAIKNLYYDMNIAEFLGHQKGDIDVDPETLCMKDNNGDIHELPQPGETMEKLKNRVNEHLKMLQITEESINTKMKSKSSKGTTIVWIVTHGLVISNVYTILKSYSNVKGAYKDTFYPSELDYMIVKIDKNGANVACIKREKQKLIIKKQFNDNDEEDDLFLI